MKLTQEDKELFAKYFVGCFSVRDTAAILGITVKMAYYRYSLPDVKAMIAEMSKSQLHSIGESPGTIIEELTAVAMGETSGKVRALELLGKHMGMFVEKVEDVTDRGHDKWTKLVDSHKVEGTDELDFLK